MQHRDLVQISETHGSPTYVYDAHAMEAQYNRLTNAFSAVPQLRINYAVKALSNLSVLKWMHHLGAGLDTVSIQEVQLGLEAGVPPKEKPPPEHPTGTPQGPRAALLVGSR